METKFTPNTEERPFMIIIGVLMLYILVAGFFAYLYFLHKIHLVSVMVIIIMFSVLYLPRFLVIYKLIHQDKVKVIDNFLMINGIGVSFEDIQNFGMRTTKPKIIFFFNNKMIVFHEADFCIKTPHEQFEFKIIGSEKIRLMKEFLKQITG